MQVLRLIANLRRLHRAKHLPSMNWTYGDTAFYSGQTSHLNMDEGTLMMKICEKQSHCMVFIVGYPHNRLHSMNDSMQDGSSKFARQADLQQSPLLHTMGLKSGVTVASSPGHSQILSRSRGEKSGEGLGTHDTTSRTGNGGLG